ncbi:MAG TPA: cytochrome c biogenesis protein CcdA [Patescibacteria group bacterium]|jgi:cytochrome c biogenesis protein CcdA
MALLVLSFLAGVLTVAAPCVLPLLPVIVGGSVVDPSGRRKDPDWRRPLVIAASLAVSIVLFTLLLKATTGLLGVPQQVWSTVSGTIVVLLGSYFLYPEGWDRISTRLNLSGRTGQALRESQRRGGLHGEVLLGASLGPVFNSCSPTYALIVATVLPVSFAEGFAYLAAYAVGLAGTLLLIAYAGQGLVKKLGWVADPRGRFRKVIGVLFVLVGLAILFGLDRDLQTYILERGWYDPIGEFEQRLGI